MNNPFKPGLGLYPPYLAGREREIKIFNKNQRGSYDIPDALFKEYLKGLF